ncbi:YceI family protein [Streptomyces sp. NPDC088354]|uniref:YceI family protein n=1 Tax=unclassified Streptomyces TaxID=2593676 RepID=UPI0029ABF778|nr:YceI family protein [Streptomyces sp. MI02-7b]MDX3073356.1 YceI family protein [Streptomyces sp. MI02-7b]
MTDSSTTPAGPRTGSWVLDPAASSVRLTHKTMWNAATVKGAFATVAGSGELAPDGTAHGTLTIEAASLDTGNTQRDTHLKSAEFFDVAAHPAIVFTARRVTADADGALAVDGELTVRGTTRPLALTGRADTASPDAVVLTVEAVVDRADFGLTWNRLGMIKGPATLTVVARFTHGG